MNGINRSRSAPAATLRSYAASYAAGLLHQVTLIFWYGPPRHTALCEELQFSMNPCRASLCLVHKQQMLSDLIHVESTAGVQRVCQLRV